MNKQEEYRKKHLAFHHSPNRFCLYCIDIGRKELIEEFQKMIDDFIFHIGNDWESYNAVKVLKEVRKELKSSLKREQ